MLGMDNRFARMVASVAILLALLAAPASAAVRGEPRTRATAPLKLRALRTLRHSLAGRYPGVGPSNEYFSSPTIADVNGDGVPEIVSATMDGFVFAFRADYSVLWSRSLGHTGFQASPAVGQLLGSSAADVVVSSMDGRIFVLDGPTGRTVNVFGQGPPLHCPPGVDCRPDGFFSTPAIADVDGDGFADIVASNYDHTVYAWRANGQLIFRQFIEDTSWSSPVVADIDGDGRREVIVGGDIYGGNNLHVPAGGLVWVFTRAGGTWHTYPGYPRSIPGQTVWSTPAVSDLNGDGSPDIVVGTGNYYPSSSTTQRVYAFTARTGRDLPGWPTGTFGQVSGGPAIVDLDGDGTREVAFASEGGRATVRNRSGSTKWTRCWGQGGCSDASFHGGVSVADLDGDGVQDVVMAGQQLSVFDGRTGALKATAGLGFQQSSGTPSIAVVKGRTILAVQGVTSDNRSVVAVFTTDRALRKAGWPCFKRTPARTG